MKWLTALALVAVLTVPAVAQDNPQPWDFTRAAGGLDLGSIVYDDGPDVQTTSSGLLFGAWLSYSLASKLSVPVTAQWDWVTDRFSYTAGARFALHGTAPTDRWHLGLGADFIYYDGPGYGGLLKQESWRATVKGTWSMLVDKGGRTIIYLPVWVDYDPENNLWRYVAALRWQVFGGA
jgi:hypothetical protein